MSGGGRLETRELWCFVAVAEELHFGAAAARLGLAQSVVSRTIAGVERRLGVRLLNRTTRTVQLTEAGSVLLGRATAALAAIEAAERATVRAAGPAARLVVAAKPDGDAGLLGPCIAAYERQPESAPTELALVGTDELVPRLRDGRADVALIQVPFDATGLDHEELIREPRVVALPSGHPLAAEDLLTLADLRGEPIARWAGESPEVDAYYRGYDPESAYEEGDTTGPVVSDLAEALRLIELGRAVTFLPTSVARRFDGRAIAFRSVADLSPSRLVIAWAEESRSRALAAFVRTATATAASLSRTARAGGPN
ncbi:LysR family transcriptional regulator [Streptomyces oryzae]|uniref:LysR family transcriptional regulator n=1 Tax=Streptomyces oryzae TaxID=1434886 RepID=A0ABS3XKH3_9ACTN|nr:LysR substrate-binding domain-containing protein [Streptomyces oryzae]MBO8195502.1 LysR family transcriptional regulator [Streptomyces oryzae]